MSGPSGMVDSGMLYCRTHDGFIDVDGGDGPCDNADTPDTRNRPCDLAVLYYESVQ